jgi:hypothetical protein
MRRKWASQQQLRAKRTDHHALASRGLSGKEMWGIYFSYANKPERSEVVNAITGKQEAIKVADTVLRSITIGDPKRTRFWQSNFASDCVLISRHSFGYASFFGLVRIEIAKPKLFDLSLGIFNVRQGRGIAA